MQTAKGEALRARLVPGRLARPGAAGAPQSCSLPLLRHLVFVLTAQPRPRVLTSTFSPIFICIPCPWMRRLSCILQALERSGPGVGRVGAPRTCRGQAAGCGACGPPAGSQPARHPPPAPALPSPLRRLLWKMLLVFQTCTGTPRNDTEQDSPPLSSHQDPRRE